MQKVILSKDFLEQQLRTKSPSDISKEIGCCAETVRRRIKKLGIIRSKHSHLINEHFFKTWSKDMAYILGFAYADGSVGKFNNRQKLVFQLNPKDISILEYIISHIQPTRSIYRYERIQSQTKRPFSVIITDFSSKILVEDLIGLGCVENKTYTEIRVPTMPKDMLSHFIRGYFDGDGSAWYTVNQAGSIKCGANIVCSSISFLEDILKVIQFGKLTKNRNLPCIEFYSKDDFMSLYNFLYSDGGFCLERKKDKLKLISEPVSKIRNTLNLETL